MKPTKTTARLAAACVGLLVFTACSGTPELDEGKAAELQSRVAATKQLTAQQDFPAALAELDQLAREVAAAADQGLMSAERKARADAAIGRIRTELEAALAAAKPVPAPSAEPPSREDKEQAEDAKKKAEELQEEAKKAAEEEAERARKEAEEQAERAKKEAEKAKEGAEEDG